MSQKQFESFFARSQSFGESSGPKPERNRPQYDDAIENLKVVQTSDMSGRFDDFVESNVMRVESRNSKFVLTERSVLFPVALLAIGDLVFIVLFAMVAAGSYVTTFASQYLFWFTIPTYGLIILVALFLYLAKRATKDKTSWKTVPIRLSNYIYSINITHAIIVVFFGIFYAYSVPPQSAFTAFSTTAAGLTFTSVGNLIASMCFSGLFLIVIAYMELSNPLLPAGTR